MIKELIQFKAPPHERKKDKLEKRHFYQLSTLSARTTLYRTVCMKMTMKRYYKKVTGAVKEKITTALQHEGISRKIISKLPK